MVPVRVQYRSSGSTIDIGFDLYSLSARTQGHQGTARSLAFKIHSRTTFAHQPFSHMMLE